MNTLTQIADILHPIAYQCANILASLLVIFLLIAVGVVGLSGLGVGLYQLYHWVKGEK